VPPVSVLYHETVKKGVEEAIDSLPEGYEIELLYQMPTSSGQAATTEQINIIETWVNQGVDAIIMCPVADDAMFEPIFKKAAEEGISVFEYGVDLSMVINQYYTSCIIYSQYDSAKAVGAWVAENYADKDLKIAMVAGPKGPYSEIREQGFKDGLASQGSHEFVASQSGDWLREKAVNVTENMLNANPDINLVYCMYDEMAMGAASAVANMDLQDKVDIVGYDMNIESLQALKAGTIKCSVYNGTKEAGQDCIKAIKQFVMDGKEINKLYLYPPKVVSYQDADQFDENLLILE
jgi:ABC-type sugar transport system substrate-binding protein